MYGKIDTDIGEFTVLYIAASDRDTWYLILE